MQTVPMFSLGFHLLFYVLAIIFVFFTLVLMYHWYTYGTSKRATAFGLSVYFIVSAPLFITMAVALHFMPL